MRIRKKEREKERERETERRRRRGDEVRVKIFAAPQTRRVSENHENEETGGVGPRGPKLTPVLRLRLLLKLLTIHEFHVRAFTHARMHARMHARVRVLATARN